MSQSSGAASLFVQIFQQIGENQEIVKRGTETKSNLLNILTKGILKNVEGIVDHRILIEILKKSAEQRSKQIREYKNLLAKEDLKYLAPLLKKNPFFQDNKDFRDEDFPIICQSLSYECFEPDQKVTEYGKSI